MTIKLRLRELLARKEQRENRKITYKVIAEEGNFAENTIAAYLNNTVVRYDRDVLQKWINFLGCQVNELFVDEPDP